MSGLTGSSSSALLRSTWSDPFLAPLAGTVGNVVVAADVAFVAVAAVAVVVVVGIVGIVNFGASFLESMLVSVR